MLQGLLNRKRVDPAEPVYTGEHHVDNPQLQLFSYTDAEIFEDSDFNAENFDGFPTDNRVHWLNMHGIHDAEMVRTICKKCGVHDLVVQDILDVNQRPKVQNFSSYWFFTLKSILPEEDKQFREEQVSFILGKNFVLSFQERKADYFDHIRDRLRNNITIIRERSADYLQSVLLEAILDNYFGTLGHIELNIDEQDELVDVDQDPSPDYLKSTERIKRKVHRIKRMIMPLRDFTAKMEREELSLIEPRHMKYYFEVRDMCLALTDTCDHLEMRLESLINLFFSVQGHRMNQVMKTLTIVATIFIPLTFVAGIYGMNFANMPELQWKWGYPAVWGIMLALFGLMMVYFRRKKWF